MTAIKIRTGEFGSSAKLYGVHGLGAAIRGLAIDHARIKIEVSTVADFTDNSTGVDAGALVDLAIPTAVFDASVAGGADGGEFHTAMGVVENALAVIVEAMNNARVRLGMSLYSTAAGTVAAANTIPSMTKSVSTAAGANAAEYATAYPAMVAAKANLRKVVHGMNELFVAMGEPKITSALLGAYAGLNVVDIPAIGDSTDGTDSVSKAVADAFLDSLADNVATLAAYWNDKMFQTGLVDLTDNSGGTANGDTVAAIMDEFTAHQDGGTDSAPLAGLNTEFAKIENNFADLAARTNLLAARYGTPELVDSTGGTANTTLEVIDDTLTAVDGTAANTASKATADVSFAEITANVATIVAAVNLLCPSFGLPVLTDSSGGAASTASTLVAITDVAGVDNGAAATGTSKAEVDASLDSLTDAMATIAAKLNAMTGTGVPSKGLSVVAA